MQYLLYQRPAPVLGREFAKPLAASGFFTP